MTVFAGYFFARDTEDEFNFTLEVFDQYNNPIKSYDFNTQIPVKRNHLTTIEGNILTIQSDITISIDDNFGGETIVDPEIAGIASPEVTATVDGNKVTLAWAAVEGATSYYIRIKGEGNVFEKTTELTKVYENLAWETTYAFEVYAANDNGNTSFTTVVENVTIGEEPVVLTYNIYLKNEDNWDAVYFYAWGDDFKTAEWPGEQMTKTTVEEVEYYVYALPAEATGKTINFLFNNGGNGKQTANIEGVVVDQNRFYTNYVEPTDLILYFQPNSNWKVDNARFAAYFFGNGDTWANLTLVEGETDIYSVTVPEGYPNIIFCRMNPNATANNWNNKWNQTADLTVPTDGKNFYVVPANSWDGSNAAWSTYTPATPEPVALATPEVTATVEVNVVTLNWNAIEGASHYTVQVDDDVEEVVNGTSYSFTGDYAVEYMFTVKAIAADAAKNLNSEAAVVTVTTEAEPVEEPEQPTYTSVADFLSAEVDDTVYYTLKGTITRVVNTSYGNFDLTDETGTIYVYGLYSEDGATEKYWATSGAQLGDDIVINATRADYYGTAQAGNARFVELRPGTLAFWAFDATSVSFTAAAGQKEIELTIYNSTAEVKAVSNNAQFSAAYANGVVTISALENTSADAIEGTVTVTCGNLSQDITVSQLGVSSGDKDTVEATISFTDKANRTSYSTSEQVWEQNGIVVTNNKGASTSNVGDYANPGRFYKSSNVTIEAPGEIVSISIDCKGLESKYVTPWGTAVDGIVTITLDGTSKTYSINNLSAQARAYSMTVTYLQ